MPNTLVKTIETGLKIVIMRPNSTLKIIYNCPSIAIFLIKKYQTNQKLKNKDIKKPTFYH